MNLKLDLNSLFKRKAKNPEHEDFQSSPSEQSQKSKKVLVFVKSNLLVFAVSAISITALSQQSSSVLISIEKTRRRRKKLQQK